jgi:hypothetical protein
MKELTRRETPDRTKINVHNPIEAKCWAHELGISQDQLRALVEKVGKFRNRGAEGTQSLTEGSPMTYSTDEQIRIRAHQLWEQSGKPNGREEEFWHQAVRDCRQKRIFRKSQTSRRPS